MPIDMVGTGKPGLGASLHGRIQEPLMQAIAARRPNRKTMPTSLSRARREPARTPQVNPLSEYAESYRDDFRSRLAQNRAVLDQQEAIPAGNALQSAATRLGMQNRGGGYYQQNINTPATRGVGSSFGDPASLEALRQAASGQVEDTVANAPALLAQYQNRTGRPAPLTESDPAEMLAGIQQRRDARVVGREQQAEESDLSRELGVNLSPDAIARKQRLGKLPLSESQQQQMAMQREQQMMNQLAMSDPRAAAALASSMMGARTAQADLAGRERIAKMNADLQGNRFAATEAREGREHQMDIKKLDEAIAQRTQQFELLRDQGKHQEAARVAREAAKLQQSRQQHEERLAEITNQGNLQAGQQLMGLTAATEGEIQERLLQALAKRLGVDLGDAGGTPEVSGADIAEASQVPPEQIERVLNEGIRQGLQGDALREYVQSAAKLTPGVLEDYLQDEAGESLMGQSVGAIQGANPLLSGMGLLRSLGGLFQNPSAKKKEQSRKRAIQSMMGA